MNRRSGKTGGGGNPRRRKRRLQVMVLLTVMSFFALAPPCSAQPMTDDEIELAVDTQLMNDDGVTAHRIDVEVKEGIVVLAGSVGHLTATERAAEIAMTVKGVRAVINNIQTAPSKRSDRQVLDDVTRALAFDPVADAGEVAVRVEDGRVFLSGRVDSWQERKLTAVAAKAVKGVRSVSNELEVKPSPRRSDTEIAVEIKRRLAWDAWVDASRIEVEVKGGRVRLAGTVGSLAEKRTAVEDCWVTGVRSVDDTGLSVDWELHRANRRYEPRKKFSEDAVRRAVRSALQYDPRVSHETVEVEVDGGVVILRGSVGLLSASKAAREDAANTAGVWRVKNHIKVRPALRPDYRPKPDLNGMIARQVRLALLLDPAVQQDRITVTANNHIVVLDGKTPSEYAGNRAEQIASAVRGVVAVLNNLQVTEKQNGPLREDWQIQNDIENELRWSPFVDEGQVVVTVDEGVAVLTGVVQDLKERRAATANAVEGGARRVKNHLKVRYGPDFLRP